MDKVERDMWHNDLVVEGPLSPFRAMTWWPLSVWISSTIIPNLVSHTGKCPLKARHHPGSHEEVPTPNADALPKSNQDKSTSATNWKHLTHQTQPVKQSWGGPVCVPFAPPKSTLNSQVNSTKFPKVGNSRERTLTLLERSSESLSDLSWPIMSGQTLTGYVLLDLMIV